MENFIFKISQKNNTQLLQFLKVSAFLVVGNLLSNHYRPYQNSQGFFDFGLADSGVGLIHILVCYILLVPPKLNYSKAREISLVILFFYLTQEIFSYFFTGFFGTFDWKDLIYYLLGFMLVYEFDVKNRSLI
ncbi:hypothetical protein [Belliella aquatica]|uniref:hypothetical protein n=1 Tax=Belliella aquatica TaxID=1323734 RepID=UPI001668C129|nr:hypothetical protein [Belliella aquatica]MCH7407659.1 hypothetical protein [Belliella aquatica]